MSGVTAPGRKGRAYRTGHQQLGDLANMPTRKQKPVNLGRVVNLLEEIAPPRLAQPWDNVGLLAGDRRSDCAGVLICIDLTQPVLAEAISAGAGLIAAYHPPIFKAISRLVADEERQEGVVFSAISQGVAIYAMHTALDAAEGGTNDVLATACGISSAEPFEPAAPESDQCKIVVFVPPEPAEGVAKAAFDSGAGVIGQYQHCSFGVTGKGSFRGGRGAHPTVGTAGRLERVEELRLEFVVPRGNVAAVVEAVRRSHPYEQPAIDVYRLEPLPQQAGIGRAGRLARQTSLRALAAKLQAATGAVVVQVVGKPDRKLTSAAVCAGAAGRMPLDSPAARRCDVIVTGEIRHHDALAFERAGKAAVALGHWASERLVLQQVARRLRSGLKGVKVRISKADRCPFRTI